MLEGTPINAPGEDFMQSKAREVRQQEQQAQRTASAATSSGDSRDGSRGEDMVSDGKYYMGNERY